MNMIYETAPESTHNSRQASNDSPSPVGLSSLTSDARTTLEDRFLFFVQQNPCFYDPGDKNFAHNQVSF